MNGKPSTNPQIDGKPLSFVRLQSTAEVNHLLRVTNEGGQRLLQRMNNGEFTDSRNVPYVVRDGIVYRVKKEKASPYRT